MPSKTEKRIIDLEHQTWAALQKSGTELIPFLAEDCCMLFPGGTIFSKDSVPSLLDILKRDDMKPWTTYELSEIRVLYLSRESRAICYAVSAQRDEIAFKALVTSIWRREIDGEDPADKGEWEMVLHQQTPA